MLCKKLQVKVHIETLYIPPDEWTGGQLWLASVSLYYVAIFPIMYVFLGSALPLYTAMFVS